MNLKNIQTHFQSYLLSNNPEIISIVRAPKNLTEEASLQIYQNSYFERAIQALSQDFPVLQHLMGKSAFSSLTRDYVAEYPSANFNLRSLGKNLPHFILSKDVAFLAYVQLAELEWIICEMQMISAHEVVRKQFQTAFNVVDLWQEYQKDCVIELQSYERTHTYLMVLNNFQLRFFLND